jgi:hypothetical protein
MLASAVQEGKGGMSGRREGWCAPRARGEKDWVTAREGSVLRAPGARDHSGLNFPLNAGFPGVGNGARWFRG